MSCLGHKSSVLSEFLHQNVTPGNHQETSGRPLSLQPCPLKETKSCSIMFKTCLVSCLKSMTVSCLQEHNSIMCTKNLTVSVTVTTLGLSAMQCLVS